ncbi:Uncharacterized protein GBIM_05043, partial [Gryllus bimaculatus]
HEFFLVPDRPPPPPPPPPAHPAVVVVTRGPGGRAADVALLPAGNRSLSLRPRPARAGRQGPGPAEARGLGHPAARLLHALHGRHRRLRGVRAVQGAPHNAVAAAPLPGPDAAAGAVPVRVRGRLNGGVYLPAPYQALLLLFAVLIQVAVGLQWLLNAPPQETLPARRLVLTAEDLVPHPVCRAAYTDVLLSLLYVACLIVFVAVLAIKSRGIRDNYREATFIGLAVGCVIPIWLVWVLSGLLVADRHRDACLAFGLVATATVGRQLAAMGKEGVYVEDREERFSTLSRAGSGYSPSFYHFKPVKYSAAPLGAPAPPPPPPLAAPPPHPHKQPATAVTTIADRVALVAAPSYTRMYHYYPYCYYPGGVYVKPEDGNVYTTLEPTLSSNPNVFFQRSGVHPGMMY